MHTAPGLLMQQMLLVDPTSSGRSRVACFDSLRLLAQNLGTTEELVKEVTNYMVSLDPLSGHSREMWPDWPQL